jgi:hypothetical protein
MRKLIDENIPEDELKNSNSTFLDPAAGNGNFMIALKTKLYNITQKITS